MGKNILIAILVVAVLGLGYVLYTDKAVVPAPQTEATNTQETDSVCAQVITPARDPSTGDIREFPTPCDVPKNWEIIENDVPSLELEVQ